MISPLGLGLPFLPVEKNYPVRIDIAKRMAARRRTRNFSILEYNKDVFGTIRRNYPKKPSEHDMKKNTRNARKYNKWAAELAAKVEEKS